MISRRGPVDRRPSGACGDVDGPGDAIEKERRDAAHDSHFRESKPREDDLFFKVLVPCGVGAYCKLIQRPLAEDVCKPVAIACAFVFPYDDLFDDHRISRERLHRVLHDPSYVPSSAEEHRAAWFYRQLVALPAVRNNAKDRAAGVHTLMTGCSHFSEVHELLERYRLSAFEKYRALEEYDEQRMETYLFELYAAGALVAALLYLDDRAQGGPVPAALARDAVRLAYNLLVRYSRGVTYRRR